MSGGVDAGEARIKRLGMRSIRRGIKEMDLILGGYARDRLRRMSDAELALYEALLVENDHDIYAWVTGQAPVPDRFAPLIADLGAHARAARAG